MTFLQKILVKNEKIDKFGLNYHRFNHQFCVFSGVLSKNTNGKKFLSQEGGYFLPCWGSIALMHRKKIYNVTTAVINGLNFKMVGLKCFVLGKIARNFVLQHPLCLRNQKFQIKTELLKRYAPKSNKHQIISRYN